jgi:hypothetical protein
VRTLESWRSGTGAIVAACALAQIVVVLAVAAREPTSGALAVVAAVVLAPVAVVGAATTARRFAGGRFPAVAAAVFVLLPFLARLFLLAPQRPAFDRFALPALVGVQETGVFAAGVAAVLVTALAPELVAAAAGTVALVVALIVWSLGAIGDLQPLLHETAWSVALSEWLVVATIAAVVLRRPLLGAALGCVAVAAILRAAHQPFGDAGFWRALAPVVPVGAVLVSALWLLVPRLRPAESRRTAS